MALTFRYYSPYPISMVEEEDASTQIKGVSANSAAKRSKNRAGRPLNNTVQPTPEKISPSLWVCEWCFKYMKDASLLELHSVCYAVA